MATSIHWDAAVRQDLASRGIDQSTGIYGEHKVQLGTGSPIRLDEIKSAPVPYAGFNRVKKVERGKEGIRVNSRAALKALYSRTGTLDAGALLSALKAMQTHTARLDELGELEPGQKQDSMWTFASEVESLSNSELSAVFQTFTSAEMDLLQTALMHEGQTNRNAVDARRAAAQLFDLQALILREISNRNVNEQIDQTAGDLSFEGMPEKVEEGVQRPKTLTGQFGGNGPVARHSREHDISAANLMSLAEVGARSATVREKTALAEQARLRARRLDAVTVKELGDTLRKADLTIKIQTEHLIGGPTSILDHPDEPMANIFHLHDQGIDPKGPGYRDERDATEKVLFPELQGHGIMADERPVYGALNLKGAKSGAISSRAGYGTSTIVLRPHVAKRATYSANDIPSSPPGSMSAAPGATFSTP